MARVTLIEPVVHDVDDVAALERAWHGADHGDEWAPTSFRESQLSIARNAEDDFQDRQIFLWVDGESWGKIRYGHTLTREVAPGRHTVRAFNTLLSRTIDVDVKPGEHARLRCANGLPMAGWLMMMFLHVTYLRVRLEPDPASEIPGRS